LAVAANRSNTCAVLETNVQCWGYNHDGELGNGGTAPGSPAPVAVLGLSSGVTAIAVGQSHACAVVMGGVQCWGLNDLGELGNGSMVMYSDTPVAVSGLSSGVTAVAAGVDYTCALTMAGAVWCWGYNADGQLGNGSTVMYSDVPVAVSGLSSGVMAIAAGDSHACAVTAAGRVQCWGSNPEGELGSNAANPSSVPVTVVEP